jgi:hypothetical protein
MNLFVNAIDILNRFIIGLLFYFVCFGIIAYLAVLAFGRLKSFEEIIIFGVALLAIGLIPAGIFINKRLFTTVKGKFLKTFLIVLQLIIAYACIGFFLYGLFWAFLWSVGGVHGKI